MGANNQPELSAQVSGLGDAGEDVMCVGLEGGEGASVVEVGHRAEVPAEEFHGAHLKAVRPLRHRGVGGVERKKECRRKRVEAGLSCGNFLLVRLGLLCGEQGPYGDFGGIGSSPLGGFRRLLRLRGRVGTLGLEVVVHSQTESRGGVVAAKVEGGGHVWEEACLDGARPFRFRGEAVVHLRLLVEPKDEKLHLVVGDVGHGQVVISFPIRVGAHDLVPEPPRDLVLGDVESLDGGGACLCGRSVGYGQAGRHKVHLDEGGVVGGTVVLGVGARRKEGW